MKSNISAYGKKLSTGAAAVGAACYTPQFIGSVQSQQMSGVAAHAHSELGFGVLDEPSLIQMPVGTFHSSLVHYLIEGFAHDHLTMLINCDIKLQ